MSPRTGRPKEDNPNIINLTVRINALLNQRLNNYCKNNGLAKGEVVRRSLENILGEKK